MTQAKKPRELTGRGVLMWLVAFFGVIFAVNGAMIKAATSTFGGVQTVSSYKAGQMFEGEVARAERQQAMHWDVEGRLTRQTGGAAALDIRVRDARGTAVDGLTVDAELVHPADERLDHVVPLSVTGAGTFRGEAKAAPGQWELVIDFYRDNKRVFRSKSRVTLK